jgi:hypothetical protein
MKIYQRFIIFILLAALSLCLVSCEKKKQAKVIITEQEFVLRQDEENSITIDVRGKIKNVGEVDVKKVVVTSYCRSCTEVWGTGKWFTGPEKTTDQKDIISYITIGNEEEFHFTGAADIFYYQGEKPPEMPEKLELVIESFETVEG